MTEETPRLLSAGYGATVTYSVHYGKVFCRLESVRPGLYRVAGQDVEGFDAAVQAAARACGFTGSLAVQWRA